MRRTLLVLVGVIGAAFFTLPASMQGPGRGRAEVQLVNGREAVAREVLVRFRDPQLADLVQLRAQTDAETIGQLRAARAVSIDRRSNARDAAVAAS